MEIQRPLDLLNNSKGKNVLVILKNGTKISGKLITFDIHLNLVLEQASIINDETSSTQTLGKILVRGDTILFVSPEE